MIPIKKDNSLTGSIFIRNNLNTNITVREKNILDNFLDGNIPDFLRKFVPIYIVEGENSIIYQVMPDVLSIGEDDDYIRMPMNPLTAKKIADLYNCTLPTKKMCNQIWDKATIKLEPEPKGPPYDNSMLATSIFANHNSLIEKQKGNKPLDKLITGHKKDIIIDKKLLSKKDRVGIYGWFHKNGNPIQGPNTNCSSHDTFYLDYSHSARLISQDILYNGILMNFFDVLNDKDMCNIISDQGPFDASKIYTI